MVCGESDAGHAISLMRKWMLDLECYGDVVDTGQRMTGNAVALINTIKKQSLDKIEVFILVLCTHKSTQDGVRLLFPNPSFSVEVRVVGSTK